MVCAGFGVHCTHMKMSVNISVSVQDDGGSLHDITLLGLCDYSNFGEPG